MELFLITALHISVALLVQVQVFLQLRALLVQLADGVSQALHLRVQPYRLLLVPEFSLHMPFRNLSIFLLLLLELLGLLLEGIFEFPAHVGYLRLQLADLSIFNLFSVLGRLLQLRLERIVCAPSSLMRILFKLVLLLSHFQLFAQLVVFLGHLIKLLQLLLEVVVVSHQAVKLRNLSLQGRDLLMAPLDLLVALENDRLEFALLLLVLRLLVGVHVQLALELLALFVQIHARLLHRVTVLVFQAVTHALTAALLPAAGQVLELVARRDVGLEALVGLEGVQILE